MRKYLVAAFAACFMSQNAFATFDLQVTEIWPGNDPGSNLTDDWFEVTNVGDMDWTSADGDLYYDDDSMDASVADLMSGITTIAAGESVIYVDGSATTGGPNVALWSIVWGPDLASMPQVGTYEGSGLSGGGDGVTLFLDSANDGVDAGDQIDFADYPNADAPNGGQSWDVGLGVFSGSLVNGITTTEVNDESNPAVGTPGFLGVPEPGTLALTAMGLFGLLGVRRK